MSERKKIVFLLKNGIGFGHFKLALTISKNFNKEKYEMIFITQAKSTRIFNGYEYKVINIPMMHLLRHNNEVLLFHQLINSILNHIKPDVVIEDTYPDNFYLNLTALVHVSKILFVNRLVASEFEELYYEGALARYDKLIILKEKKEYMSTTFSNEVKNFVNYSDQMAYCGNVFNCPSKAEKKFVREKYHFKNFQKTIVVNCGAGGWHIGENVCKTIFEQIVGISNAIIDQKHNYQFIFLLGPYSEYMKEELDRQVVFKNNVVFVDFEDSSDALFQECDLVILRPGYNSTMEALSGCAQVILLPGISYMEEQDSWCEELKYNYNIDYINVNSLELLKDKIIERLSLGMAQKRIVENNCKEVVKQIIQVINQNTNECILHTVMLGFNLNECNSEKVKVEISKLIDTYDLIRADLEHENNRDQVFDSQSRIPVINRISTMMPLKKSELVSAIYLDELIDYNQNEFYDKRYHLTETGTIVLNLVEVIVSEFEYSTKKLLYAIRNSDRYADGIILKIVCNDDNEEEVLKFIKYLKYKLDNNVISHESIRKCVNRKVDQKFYCYKKSYYKPEIAKLK